MRSVILKNIFRFAFRRWDKIPNDELKGYSIYIFLVGLLIGCLLFGLMKVLFKWSFNELIMILLANSVFSFLFSMVIYIKENGLMKNMVWAMMDTTLFLEEMKECLIKQLLF